MAKGLSMLTSDQLRNLRAGPVCAGALVKPGTMRAWIANNELRLGDREGRESGNPRYDLADCARLTMLGELSDAGMAAASAVWIVNKAWDYFITIAERELRGIDDTSQAPDCPRYILSVPISAFTSETNPTIRLWSHPDEVAERNDTRGVWMVFRAELREIVRRARDVLITVGLGESLAGLRHDFADAPHPQG
jgi:hypothetical protein